MPFKPPNSGLRGNARGSSSMPPTPGPMASPVQTPDHRFSVGLAKMPQPPAAVEPGKGAVPIEPFTVSGLPNRITVPEPDTAKGMK